MEVELSLDIVDSCNFARKRQAAMESCTEIQLKVSFFASHYHVCRFLFCFGSLDAVICVAASKILRCMIYTLYFWITGRSDHNRDLERNHQTN